MSLAKKLVDVPQPEKGGRIAQDRFHYQALWGLLLVFKSYENGEDFAVAFEFHDDVIALNSSTAPSKIAFYQIKTKEKGHWLLTDLFRRKAGKDSGKKLPSYMGKLFSRLVDFPDHTTKMTFVSNAFLKDNATGKGEISFTECGVENFSSFFSKLREEHPSATAEQASLMRYEKSALSLDDATTHAKGVMNNFIVASIGAAEINLDAFYQAIIEDCRMRSNYDGPVNSIEDLVKYKAITRADADKWIGALKNHSAVPGFDDVVQDLELKPLQKSKLRGEWQKYKLKVLDASDEPIRVVRKAIKAALDLPEHQELNMNSLVTAILTDIGPLAAEYMPYNRESTLTAMILYEVAVYGLDQFQAPTKKSKDSPL